MKKTNAVAAAAAGVLVTAGLAVSWRDGHRFVVRHYQISSPKIRENTRIVFLSDLHSQVYGKKNDPDGPNGPLLRAIRSLNPDAVMIGGDMIVAKDAAYDKPGWKEVPLDLIEKLAKEFPVYADWGADLVLSGHIHGGIIRLGPKGPGLLSPDWHFFPDYTGGEYRIRREDGTEAVMVLSCGTGTHSLHLRFMNPGEVSLLELSRC